MTVIFTRQMPLRFAHCDPAGIAYYPRYFEICDAVIEDWTAECFGVPRQAMHGEMKLGMPTVDLHARFSAPSRLGDRLDLQLVVTGVGRTSVDLAITVGCNAEPRFSVTYRQVLMAMDTARAVPWPEDWRTKLMAALA